MILVLNIGSSSLKYALFEPKSLKYLNGDNIEKGPQQSTEEMVEHFFNTHKLTGVTAIGHRIVHGGALFDQAVEIDDTVFKKIESISYLAPLHNPYNLYGVKLAKEAFNDVKQVAVFDTAFHQSMPEVAYRYAIRDDLDPMIRRYGFHGTSHQYLAQEAAHLLNQELSSLKLITLHLGNGASACAIQHGKSVDTSMGFTPLEGLVMGTRSGDIDPSIITYLQKQGVDDVERLLNKESGLKGLCGEQDMRHIIATKEDNPSAQLAYELFIYRIIKYVGAYIAVLEGVDALVLSGGIGENALEVQEDIQKKLTHFKIPHILIIKTDEELSIAQQTQSLTL